MNDTPEYLEIGDACTITTMLGLDARTEKAKVVSYLGNGQYTVETDHNRYLRYLDGDGNETGIDAIKALLMRATDLELLECKEFINSQLEMMRPGETHK